jgi:hypothetical protein
MREALRASAQLNCCRLVDTQNQLRAESTMLNKIVVLNLALIITHQIDAAYWHEWEMFALPGGIQFFNFLNFFIFLFLVSCFIPVTQRKRFGFAYSIVIAAMCSLALPIHTGFAIAGFTQFHLPSSIIVIVLTFLVSIVQIFFTFRARHEFVA